MSLNCSTQKSGLPVSELPAGTLDVWVRKTTDASSESAQNKKIQQVFRAKKEKVSWTADESSALKEVMRAFGPHTLNQSWREVKDQLSAVGIVKSSKQIAERWRNIDNPSVKSRVLFAHRIKILCLVDLLGTNWAGMKKIVEEHNFGFSYSENAMKNCFNLLRSSKQYEDYQALSRDFLEQYSHLSKNDIVIEIARSLHLDQYERLNVIDTPIVFDRELQCEDITCITTLSTQAKRKNEKPEAVVTQQPSSISNGHLLSNGSMGNSANRFIVASFDREEQDRVAELVAEQSHVKTKRKRKNTKSEEVDVQESSSISNGHLLANGSTCNPSNRFIVASFDSEEQDRIVELEAEQSHVKTKRKRKKTKSEEVDVQESSSISNGHSHRVEILDLLEMENFSEAIDSEGKDAGIGSIATRVGIKSTTKSKPFFDTIYESSHSSLGSRRLTPMQMDPDFSSTVCRWKKMEIKILQESVINYQLEFGQEKIDWKVISKMLLEKNVIKSPLQIKQVWNNIANPYVIRSINNDKKAKVVCFIRNSFMNWADRSRFIAALNYGFYYTGTKIRDLTRSKDYEELVKESEVLWREYSDKFGSRALEEIVKSLHLDREDRTFTLDQTRQDLETGYKWDTTLEGEETLFVSNQTREDLETDYKWDTTLEGEETLFLPNQTSQDWGGHYEWDPTLEGNFDDFIDTD